MGRPQPASIPRATCVGRTQQLNAYTRALLRATYRNGAAKPEIAASFRAVPGFSDRRRRIPYHSWLTYVDDLLLAAANQDEDRLKVRTSSLGVGGFTSDTADASAVAAVENLWGAAGLFDALVTWWWPRTFWRRCGEDERSNERGDQRCEKQHCA